MIYLLSTVDGYWYDWGEWGPCSVTCGGGTQERTRNCETPQHGGNDCEGENNESQICGEINCPGMLHLFVEYLNLCSRRASIQVYYSNMTS